MAKVLVDYDPEKHKGLPLYEVVTVKVEGDPDLIGTTYRPAKVPEEVAAKIPWYYVVEVEEEEA
jgi:hypothetical protein